MSRPELDPTPESADDLEAMRDSAQGDFESRVLHQDSFHRGQRVTYTAYIDAPVEHGVVTKVAAYVFVRFGADEFSKACAPDQLTITGCDCHETEDAI